MQKHARRAVILVLGALLITSCGDDQPSSDAPADSTGDSIEETPEVGEVLKSEVTAGQPQLALEVVATGLRAPTSIASAPGDDRLFVLERLSGQVRIVQDGEVLDEPFLDVGARLEENGDGREKGRGERGLLALAFHPDYASNGRWFLYYADLSGLSELVEYQVSDNPDRADPDSAVVLQQWGPSNMHYGGQLQFAPDGTLWFSLGAGTTHRDASDLTSPRGKLHRYDVSTPGVAVAAEGNPYLGDDPGADEVWASGLRNPWRMTIDGEAGLVYIGDVGDIGVEEINVTPIDEAGVDYGWPHVEGTTCWTYGDCDASGTQPPTVEVLRKEGVCSIIGGPVYRGEQIPELQGAYLFSDYCRGFLRTFRFEGGAVNEEVQWFDDIARISSFGVDSDGEVYMVDQPTGTLRKLVPAP